MIKKVGLYDSNGDVVNVVLIDDESDYTPPTGLTIIDDPTSNIGDTVAGGSLIPKPEEPEPPPPPDTRTVEEKIRSEYVDQTTMLEAAFKQFKAMEDSGTILEPETKAVLDSIQAAEAKYR